MNNITPLKDAYTAAANESTRERREPWNDLEIELLVNEFIEQRRADPFTEALELLRQAMRKALPEHRAKNITTWAQVQAIRPKLGDKWLEETTKQNPEPIIVHVETQAPPDFVDILNRCDLPSLVALVVAKLQGNFAELKPLLTVLTPPEQRKSGAPAVPPVSLLAAASAKPRHTRVLIVGLFKDRFHDLENRIKEASIPVDLIYFAHNERPTGIIQCDHVVAKFVNKHLNDQLRATVPAGRYHIVEGDGISTFTQKVRDIGALLSPRT